MSTETINLPQILAVAVVSFLLYRWFTTPSSASPTSTAARNNQRQTAASAVEHVNQVSQMFPQLDRRAIMWDLQRNGNSVQATIERVLGGRSLDSPPPSFQPQLPTPPPQTTTTTPAAQRPTTDGKMNPDLITRYNLSSRLSTSQQQQQAQQQQQPTEETPSGKPQGWSANKNERAEMLKRRREEMVLAARRKMEEKDRSGGASASA